MKGGGKMKKAPSEIPTKKKRLLERTFVKVMLMVIWVFSSVIASQLVVGFVMGLILKDALNQPVWSGIYSVLSYGLALLLIILVPPKLHAKWKTSREEIGLTSTPTWTDIGLAPIGFIVGTALAAALVWVFEFLPWFNAGEAQDVGFTPYMATGEKAIAFLVLVILAPIVEEVIFRGWLYGKLRARLNAPVAILITSLLFAVMHFQWNVGVNVFALSVVLCAMREVTGTIYAGIMTHMIKNGVAFYLLYVIGLG